MEETITVDGKQFILTADIPLTAEQKAQTIAEIRKQTGCDKCGSKSDWQHEEKIAAMQTCTKTITSSNIEDVVTLVATPDRGTAPYTVTFLGQFGAAPVVLATGTSPYGLTGTNPQTGLPNGQITSSVTYQITDAQIIASAGGPPVATDVNGSGINVPAGAANTIRFLVHTSDSCPTGAKHCVEYCDLGIVCAVPTCSFTVT